MKITKQQLLYLISESLKVNEATGMTKGSYGINLSSLTNFTFKIDLDGSDYNLYAYFKGEEIAFFQLDSNFLKLGYYVTHSDIWDPAAAKGGIGKIGPFLYDILIELGSLLGYWVGPSSNPSGVIGDPGPGSRAIDVWIYYNRNRNDLQKKMLKEQEKGKSRSDIINRYLPKELQKSNQRKEEIKSAMIHVYKKQPIFLTALYNAGKIIRIPSHVEKLISSGVKKEEPVTISMPNAPKQIAINVPRKVLNQKWAKQYFGDDARYWAKDWQMIITNETFGTSITPNPRSPNETIVNGKAINSKTLLEPNNIISIGREKKRIFKSQFQVIKD